MGNSLYLAGLAIDEMQELRCRLHIRQSGVCYICEKPIDLEIHDGHLDIDHIEPITAKGADAENNFALTHQSCNRSKGASDLRVAKILSKLRDLQGEAKKRGERGANLEHILNIQGGANANLRLTIRGSRVEFSFPEIDDNDIRSAPLHHDQLSGVDYFFTVVPLEYIHHDDRINPRNIGGSIRGLIEEFLKGYPQLHVGLAWWAAQEDSSGPLKLFDGQHKAAAQIMLGAKELPVRVFVNPDIDSLTTANTNAGSKLRQVAFDKAVMRHLGSTLYMDRVDQYQKQHGLLGDDYSFSESDLVRFFKGQSREMRRYIVDAQRDAITHNENNLLLEFIEWSGKSADRPMAYSTVESAFFPLLYQKALDIPIDHGLDDGTNPRIIERNQIIRLMDIFADVFFKDKWDPDIGGNKIEARMKDGENISPDHLRAWRIAREEIAVNVMRLVKRVIEHYNAFNGKFVDSERLLHDELTDNVWVGIKLFLGNLGKLPCWTDREFSLSVFGPKQNLGYWESIFKTGKSPTGTLVLAQGLDLSQMIVAP